MKSYHEEPDRDFKRRIKKSWEDDTLVISSKREQRFVVRRPCAGLIEVYGNARVVVEDRATIQVYHEAHVTVLSSHAKVRLFDSSTITVENNACPIIVDHRQ